MLHSPCTYLVQVSITSYALRLQRPGAKFAVGTGDMTATVGPRGDDVALGVIRTMDDFLTAGAVSSGFLAENHVVTRESLRRERHGRRRYMPYL
ncbi:hypothetical protein RAH42_03090 [Pyramidobacter sp. YE332]|uniref:hypothetical protein n=1 Tax=Pyramidobacter sp. YE332 TaxID=3068894 RepID=UPI00294B0BFA|nr:hypothetical protein [Pyramidobacter sp. YE332]WOL40636.1 hypothetical protein RAH42_03090 [Pyramidobacter sp. YE332]